MVERSRERAPRQQTADKIEFKVADAQSLPFEDGLFDAVITESVTAFPEDKQQAVNEYVRVTMPPPPEVVAWAAQEVGANVKPLTQEAWSGLLVAAGLNEITVKIFAVSLQDEAKGILRRYGFRGMAGIVGRMLLLYARNPAYRKFVREIRRTGIVPQNLEEYFGYGLFVGRKTL
jgi:arsenite methyltransferase